MFYTEIETYRDLLSALKGLSDEKLSQTVQIADPPNDCRPVELEKGLAIGTVAGFEFEGARSVKDNRYHADEIVILVDSNPFAEDGAIAYELKHEGPEGGKPIMRHVPRYTNDGPTRETQMAPNTVEHPVHLVQRLKSRTKNIRVDD